MTARVAVVAFCGGVGGAKIALGLQHVVAAGELAIVVNIGDDFEHLGLSIAPDLDTVMYTLAGVVEPQNGWGRADDTGQCMTEIERLCGPTWFRLGDRDLAVHIERSQRLRAGATLAAVTSDLVAAFRIPSQVWPVSNDAVRTVLETDEGRLAFQHYFVRRRCEPRVTGIRFEDAADARPLPEVVAALASPALMAVVICPSNPYLSVDPMLAIPGLRAALAACRAPVVAVSPIIAGRAVKGPTAKLMRELGVEVSAASVAHHYSGLIDGYVMDGADVAQQSAIRVATSIAPTLMTTLDDRVLLAQAVLDFAARLKDRPLSRAS